MATIGARERCLTYFLDDHHCRRVFFVAFIFSRYVRCAGGVGLSSELRCPSSPIFHSSPLTSNFSSKKSIAQTLLLPFARRSMLQSDVWSCSSLMPIKVSLINLDFQLTALLLLQRSYIHTHLPFATHTSPRVQYSIRLFLYVGLVSSFKVLLS